MPRSIATHARIRDTLRSQIQDGTLRPGDQLPTEHELIDQYAVSRHTVRVALQALVSEGLIERHAGYGTFVTSYATDPGNTRVVGDDRYIFGLTAGTRLQIVEPFATVNDAAVAKRLNARTSEVARLSFTRSAHGHTIGYWLIWLPRELYAEISPQVETLHGGSDSVISLLERTTRHVAQRAEQDLTAEAASADVAAMLGVETNAPLLRAERTYFDAADRPLEHVLVRYVPAHFSYRLHVLRTRATGAAERTQDGDGHDAL